MPANGRHGMAQVEGRMFVTSGTCTIRRPVCSGSTLSSTIPRYLPKYCPVSGMTLPLVRKGRDHRQVGDEGVALEDEALLVLAGFDLVGTAVDVVHPVEGQAGAAHPDQAARPKHLPVPV